MNTPFFLITPSLYYFFAGKSEEREKK